MCFFIGGISPKTKILDQNPRLCPVCGLVQAYFKRVDHYLHIFFIPVIRVKKGEPFIACNRCERKVFEFGEKEKEEQQFQTDGRASRCINCGKTLEKDFKYCPYCGKPI